MGMLFAGSASYTLAQTSTAGDKSDFPLSPDPVSGVLVVRDRDQSIIWEQETYSAPEGARVLTNVITDKASSVDRRKEALSVLTNAARTLKGTEDVARLVTFYATLVDPSEKALMIGCIGATEDPRGLQVIHQFMSEATDDTGRFQGSYALAKWNIRAGVKGLFVLLQSKQLGPDNRPFAEVVVSVLQSLSTVKGWGLNDQSILGRINDRKELTEN